MDQLDIKILIIDDIQEDGNALKFLLRKYFPNSEVSYFMSGLEGYEQALSLHPDMIITDVHMPGMDGFEVCRKIKEDPLTRDIPVIFLTAHKFDRAERIKALEAGADGFLNKPPDPPELIAQVRAMYKLRMAAKARYLENSRLRDAWKDMDIKFNQERMERQELESLLKHQVSVRCPEYSNQEDLRFEDLFNIDEIQKIQDEFAYAVNIASIITYPDGSPITRPSNFTRLCKDIIRNTEKGCANCYKSDAVIGGFNPDGPTIKPCLSGGLWDAGVSISVGGKHVANWLIGQIRNETQHPDLMMNYAAEIGANPVEFRKALDEVPSMSYQQFERMARYLHTFSLLIANQAWHNIQQARLMAKRNEVIEVLHQTKQTYIDMFNTISEAIYIQDAETGVFLDVNKGAEEIYKCSKEEIVGQTPFSVAAEGLNDLDAIWENSGRVFKTGEPIRFEFWAKRKTGEIFPKEVIVNKGKYFGKDVLIATARDITVQKKYEESLKTSYLHKKALLDALPDMMFVFDKDHTISDFHANSEDVLFASPEAFLGKKPEEVLPPDIAKKTSDRIDRVISTGLPDFHQYDLEINGELRSFEARGVPYGENQALSIVRDLTEQKKAEKINKVQYNITSKVATTNSIHDFMEYLQNQLNTLIDATNFYVAFYHEANGMLLTPYFIDERDQTEEWPMDKSLTGLVIQEGKPLLFKRADIDQLIEKNIVNLIGVRSECWLGVPMFAENKVIGAFVVQSYSNPEAFSVDDMEMLAFVSQNVSIAIQRIRKDQELREALGKALESDKVKTAFLQNMSHEVRTPLNGIIGFSTLLAEGHFHPDDLASYAGSIKNSGNRLLGLLDNIIEISQLDAGFASISPKIVDPAEIMKEVMNQYLEEAHKKNLLIARCHDSPEGVTIMADPKKLIQVLANLLNNAVKFTRAGSITVGYQIHDSAIQFSVKDTGIGIPKQHHGKIFDRFYQVDNSLSRGHEGAGLGLSICKGLVNVMGGEIWVESEPGEGSVFNFRIPCKVKGGTANAPIRTESKRSNQNLNILVAEDEYANFQFIRVILEKQGHSVYHAENGLEAVEIIRNNPDIDLVLMDMKMPLMDGFTATRQIRSFNNYIPIIAVTAYALSGDRERVLEAGCNDYLAKPVKQSDIVNSVKHIVETMN